MDELKKAIHDRLLTMKQMGLELDDDFVAKQLADYFAALMPHINSGVVKLTPYKKEDE